jgi:phosphoglycerol transferase
MLPAVSKDSDGPPSLHTEAPVPTRSSEVRTLGALLASTTDRTKATLRSLESPLWLYTSVSALTFVLWSAYYERWVGQSDFRVPIGYLDGDHLWVLGVGKTFADLPAPWNITAPRLNAPDGAAWNDFPHPEKLLLYVSGVLHRFFSVGTAANLASMLAHLSAALAFVWAARALAVPRFTASVAALLFAYAPFMMGRSLGHLFVAYVWHLPLLLFLVKRLDALPGAAGRRAWVGGIGLMALSSLQNPYYAIIGLSLVGLATLRCGLNRNKTAFRYGGILVLTGAAIFGLNQLNVFLYRIEFGPNPTFSGRSLRDFMSWGLRLPDLFMPASHPFSPWADFARTRYFEAGNPGTENATAFLGATGIVLFVLLVGFAVTAGMRGRWEDIPIEAWLVGYVLLFAVAGGVNYLLASFGFTWLRSANRYSILMLCALLLWGCQALHRRGKPTVRAAVVAGAALIGLWELFGMRPGDLADRKAGIAEVTSSDEALGRELERALPDRAAVFELPVADFPEGPSVNQMAAYELMRPYLFTRALRFSYGAHKGRSHDNWQRRVEGYAPKKMLAHLRRRGFDAIVINRRGYPDGARELEASLKGVDLKPIATSRSNDLVAYGSRSVLPGPPSE